MTRTRWRFFVGSTFLVVASIGQASESLVEQELAFRAESL